MFVKIRSYNSCNKADYVKYRLQRANIECITVPFEEVAGNTKESYSIEVAYNQVEQAVSELLKIHTEYPNEGFELKTDPTKLLRLLVPIDFSDKSFEACKYALDIAAKRPVEIKFLHVWNDELADSVAVRNSYMVEDFKRIERAASQKEINEKLDVFSQKLKQHIAETATQGNILFHFTIAEGMIKKQIEQSIKRYQPQLIIVAHNTDTECKFRISREIANGIIDLAYCPVFYIPQKVYYKPLGKLAVSYATTFSKNDINSFKVLQELAVGYDTTIHCLHVTQKGQDTGVQDKMDTLEKQLLELKPENLKIYTDVWCSEDLLDGFVDYIHHKKIDMLAFTSPEYGIWHKLFNPDKLKSIMQGSLLPLLIFRYKG